jgi:hypothetical protein
MGSRVLDGAVGNFLKLQNQLSGRIWQTIFELSCSRRSDQSVEKLSGGCLRTGCDNLH